jgi:uncharacterized protein
MNNIEQFLQSNEFAVVGASSNRTKFGNKVLRCYMQHNMTVYPVHPIQQLIEDLPVFSSISELPHEVNSISIITSPRVTEEVINQAIKKGIKNIWMQPGAESERAIQNCLNHNINVIAKGPCILVLLGFDERLTR